MPRSTSHTLTASGMRATGSQGGRVYSNISPEPNTRYLRDLRSRTCEASSSAAIAAQRPLPNDFSKISKTKGTSRTMGAKAGKRLPAADAHFFLPARHTDPLCPPAMSLEEVMKCNENAIEALRQNELDKSHELISRALQVSEDAIRWFQKDASVRERRRHPKSAQNTGENAQKQRVHHEGWLLLHAVSLNNMGCQLRREGKVNEALDCLERARNVETHVCGRPSCSTMMNLSTLLLSMDKVEEAFPIAQECVMAAQDGDRVLFITALHNLAITLGRHQAAKERSAALTTMLRALREAQNHFGSDHTTTALLKSLCDESHGWILTDAPKKPSHPRPPASPTPSHAKSATKKAALSITPPRSAKPVVHAGRTQYTRKRPPAHLTPLSHTAPVVGGAPIEDAAPLIKLNPFDLQVRAQEALATLHFGTPAASPKCSNEMSAANPEKGEDPSHSIAAHIPRMSSCASSPHDSEADSADVEIRNPVDLDAPSHTEAVSGESKSFREPETAPEDFIFPTTEDAAAVEPIEDPPFLHSSYEAAGPQADPSKAPANPPANLAEQSVSSAPTSDSPEPPRKDDEKASARASAPQDGPLFMKKESDLPASTVVRDDKIPGYYINLSPTSQPKFLRFLASGSTASAGAAAVRPLQEEPPREASRISTTENIKTHEATQRDASSRFGSRDGSRDGAKATSSSAQGRLFDREASSNSGVSASTRVLDKDVDATTQPSQSPLSGPGNTIKSRPLKIFRLAGDVDHDTAWRNAIREELEEEERFRQKRAREQLEEAKEAERQAILRRIRARVEDRAARRIQLKWRRWWRDVGWACREARRVRAAERLRCLKEKKNAAMLARGEVPLSANPSSCQYYGMITAAVSCGMKWFERTVCVRYLSRKGLPHRGLKERDIYHLVAKIQAVWRGFSTRLHALQQNATHAIALSDLRVERYRRERREYAAIVLQKFIRTILSKKRLAAYHFERYDPPARRLQAWFRTRMASLRGRGVDRLTVWTRKTAALRIQRAWRRHQLRIQYYMYLLRLRMSALRDEESRAAPRPLLLLAPVPGLSQEAAEGVEEERGGVVEEGPDGAEEEEEEEDVVPRTRYERECLARSAEVARLRDAEHDRFHVALFSEPAAARARKGWADAIDRDSLASRRERAAAAYLRRAHAEEAAEGLARGRAAVRIQRAFRGWLRMRDNPARDRALLLHSRQAYQRREGERREELQATAAARIRAIKRYGDVASPMRKYRSMVCEELRMTMQNERPLIMEHHS